MNINKHTVAAVALALWFGSPAFAREPLTVVELTDHLEELLADCNWKTRSLTGGPLGKMLLHKRTMEDVLEALKAGRVIESRKLEEALKAHPR